MLLSSNARGCFGGGGGGGRRGDDGALWSGGTDDAISAQSRLHDDLAQEMHLNGRLPAGRGDRIELLENCGAMIWARIFLDH